MALLLHVQLTGVAGTGGRPMNRLFAGVSVVATLALASPVSAATPNLDKCLDFTGRSATGPSWPLGYPCKPFAHRSQTIAFVREILVGNGFRRASIRITSVHPRQFQFQAIQDGIDYFGAVARSGDRQIAIRLDSAIRSGGGAGTYRFATRFDP